MNLPCWLSVICWNYFILYFQKVAYNLLIHNLAKYYQILLIICQTQTQNTTKNPRKEKNRCLTNNLGIYKRTCIKIKALSFRFQNWHVKSLQVVTHIFITRKSWTNWKLKIFIAFMKELKWQANQQIKLWRGRHIQRDTDKIFLFCVLCFVFCFLFNPGRDAAEELYTGRGTLRVILMKCWRLNLCETELAKAKVLWENPIYSWILPLGIPSGFQSKDLRNSPSWLWQGKGWESGIILKYTQSLSIIKIYVQGKEIGQRLDQRLIPADRGHSSQSSLSSLTVSPKSVWGNETLSSDLSFKEINWACCSQERE